MSSSNEAAKSDGAQASPSLPNIARRSARHGAGTSTSGGAASSSATQQAPFALGRDSEDDPSLDAAGPSSSAGKQRSINTSTEGEQPGRFRPYRDEEHDGTSSRDYSDDDEHASEDDDEAALMLGPASASTSDLREDNDGAIELGTRKSRRKRRKAGLGSRASAASGVDISEKYDKDDPLYIISKAVPEHDDATLPALTWRALMIGSFFCVIGAAVSQLFFYKSNSPSFSTYFVILVSLPIGKWLARKLPDRTIGIGPWSFELNPGPFSLKEHMLIAIISSSGATSAGATDIINIQELFYNQRMSWLASLTLLLSSQVLGFSWAGLVTDLLVKPPVMIWPSTLVTCSLFHTLHDGKSPQNRARQRMFFFVFIAIFVYQFLPALIAPTLSSIAVLCLVNHENKAFRILGSGYHGLGIGCLSLDWNVMGMSGPLYQPWWAALNFYAGIAGFCWIVMPLLYFFFNMWDAQSFPDVLGSGLFHANFTKFDVTGLLNPDSTLDRAKWEQSKPMLLTPSFAMLYGFSFAALTSVLTHTLLYHWQDIKKAVQKHQYDDVHNRLMRAYEPVPKMWYFWTFITTAISGCILVITTPALQLPVWALLLAIFMGPVFLIPVGILRAVSDVGIGLNVISELLIGFIYPGRPIGNTLFKILAYQSLAQALDLLTDLKAGHHLKIPPKSLFVAQLLGTAIGSVVNLIVVNVILDPASGYRGYLDGSVKDPSGQWDGRKVHIFFSASVIWGLIGPAEFFDGKYRILYIGFLLGAVLPIIPYLLHRRYGGKVWNKIAIPIILHGACAPPGVPSNIIAMGFGLSYWSQKYMRLSHPRWFSKYMYVVSGALDAGASVNALAIFLLSVTILKAAPIPNWAGNPSSDSEYCEP